MAVAIIAFMLMVVGALDEHRRDTGTQRFQIVYENLFQSSLDEGETAVPEFRGGGNSPPAYVVLLARLSTHAQISRTIAMAEANGYYNGESLEYLTYVLIPRIVWPSKPKISPGQWYARKLGRGRELKGGGFSNSIDMTVPGELYLNFGWPGVLAGLSFVGALYYYFRTDEFDSNNFLQQGFLLILLNQAMVNGSHFGGMVFNLIIFFVTFYLVGLVQPLLVGRRAAGASAPAGPGLPPAGPGLPPGGVRGADC